MNQEEENILADVRAGWRRSQFRVIQGGKKDSDKSSGLKPKLKLIKGEGR